MENVNVVETIKSSRRYFRASNPIAVSVQATYGNNTTNKEKNHTLDVNSRSTYCRYSQ